MPDKLAQHLPNVNATERAELFGSITSIAALPYDDPTRQGVIAGKPPPFAFRHLRSKGGVLTCAFVQRTAT